MVHNILTVPINVIPISSWIHYIVDRDEIKEALRSSSSLWSVSQNHYYIFHRRSSILQMYSRYFMILEISKIVASEVKLNSWISSRLYGPLEGMSTI